MSYLLTHLADVLDELNILNMQKRIPTDLKWQNKQQIIGKERADYVTTFFEIGYIPKYDSKTIISSSSLLSKLSWKECFDVYFITRLDSIRQMFDKFCNLIIWLIFQDLQGDSE